VSTQIDRVLRSNLKLKHLQLLVALDQFRHLGRAAEFLSLTQPAVSKTLAEIEKLFGLTLFERSTRGTEPTPPGASVVRFARTVLADYERTRDEIAAVAAGAAGRVSVGAMVVAIPVLLARAVEIVKQRSPLTAVLVEEGDLTRLLPRLRLGELDVFVGRLEPGYAAPDLETERLYEEPMAIVLPPGHALLTQRKPGWAALAGLPWVVPPPWASLRTKLDQTFYRFGLHPPTDVIETASFLGQVTFLRERGAAALMARSVARCAERDGLAAVLPLTVPIVLPPVGLITLRGRRVTPAASQLIDALRASNALAAGTDAARAGAARADVE
jgi:DNA-binding transcriptional LysR family regulator